MEIDGIDRIKESLPDEFGGIPVVFFVDYTGTLHFVPVDEKFIPLTTYEGILVLGDDIYFYPLDDF